jgi:hypothetical protein
MQDPFHKTKELFSRPLPHPISTQVLFEIPIRLKISRVIPSSSDWENTFPAHFSNGVRGFR